MEQTSIDDPAYRAAVIDLLGVLAYGELTAFIRMAVDSDLAPSLAVKAPMAGLAKTEYRQFALLVDRLAAMGRPRDRDGAFVVPFAAYHERTRPKGWLEGLVKAYVGDGIAKDFYREMSLFVDDDTRGVMERALDDAGRPTSSSASCATPSRPTAPPAGGWRCGAGACSVRPSPRPRPSPSSATR